MIPGAASAADRSMSILRDRLLSSIQALRAVAAWLVVFHHDCATFKVAIRAGGGWRSMAAGRWGSTSSCCFAAIAGLGAASYHLLEQPAGRLVVRRLSGPRGGRLAAPPVIAERAEG